VQLFFTSDWKEGQKVAKIQAAEKCQKSERVQSLFCQARKSAQDDKKEQFVKKKQKEDRTRKRPKDPRGGGG
jgi:hypothetical protein